MRNYKAVQVKEWVVSEVVCNKCGKGFDYDDISPESDTHYFETRHRKGITKEAFKFDLCDMCLRLFYLEFEIQPVKKQ